MKFLDQFINDKTYEEFLREMVGKYRRDSKGIDSTFMIVCDNYRPHLLKKTRLVLKELKVVSI